ncbi:Anti-sigma F factor antagonist [Gossypium arboreum]|uniref:Anti-sigma F factor antagonist n=1 Tax=Gossypium arboreum TaxID=29729 RepID=A0A0B0MWF3_GOSAR|nr:Anti-sigma F factor antagonist [Gossypium arboreum]
MFTQGLDKDAFRWVRAGGAAKNRDFFGVTMAAKQALDPITSLRNAGLPPSAKFRNGHLSQNIIPVSGNDDGSESDMDISSDSEEHAHDGQYSFISSPQDDKVHNVAAASMQKSEAHGHYGPQLKLGNGAQRPAQYRSNNGGAPPGEAYNSDSYSSTVTSRVFHTGGMQKVKPFHYDTIIQDNSGDEILDQSVRTVEHGGTNESTNNMPTRRPIFHASGLGPWCAVLSYDACVRLCLNSWAKGCTEEAPYFLNQECAELRKAFGLQQVLLQPEEELLAKQSSELVSEAAAPKSKRFIGKMKVQVRKVKMGLDPPPGCNLSIVKMESVHQRFCKVNSMLHSGWEALRKVRLAPNTPVNGSLSKQSLAYLQASSQYIKEVSKLLKTGVTTLRSNSTSYEEIPGP